MSGKRSRVVVVDRKILESVAFRELDGKAAKVLMWFLAKRQFVRMKGNKRQEWVQINNGEIIFTYNEALEQHKMSGQVFSRLIEDLLNKGFIDIEIPGIGVGKASTKYAISKRWEKYGTADFVAVIRHKREGHKFPTGKNHPVHRRQSNGKIKANYDSS